MVNADVPTKSSATTTTTTTKPVMSATNGNTRTNHPLVILVTGASSGFGLLTAQMCARAGHTVYASHMPHQTSFPGEAAKFSRDNKCTLRAIPLDITDDDSCTACVKKILHDAPESRLDVLCHNAGHMVYGPAEAFTPEQFVRAFEVNCIGAQRLNRAALPYMRRARKGLLIWVSSSSVRGPCSPFLGPYFAAKAAMDSLAQTYSVEVSRWGIETSIVVPGIFTAGTNHFKDAGDPDDKRVEEEYLDGPYKGVDNRCLKGSESMCPPDADPADVGRAILELVTMKRGTRPFRVHIEPAKDGSAKVNGVADQVREEFLERMGCHDLLEVDLSA